MSLTDEGCTGLAAITETLARGGLRIMRRDLSFADDPLAATRLGLYVVLRAAAFDGKQPNNHTHLPRGLISKPPRPKSYFLPGLIFVCRHPSALPGALPIIGPVGGGRLRRHQGRGKADVAGSRGGGIAGLCPPAALLAFSMAESRRRSQTRNGVGTAPGNRLSRRGLILYLLREQIRSPNGRSREDRDVVLPSVRRGSTPRCA